MSDYKVPSDQPDYQVPIDAPRDGCPRCGSRAILPTMDTILRYNSLPRELRVSMCAQCGTRYRARPKLPTWADLGRDVVTFLVIMAAVVGLCALINLFS